ncbi:phage portal protein [Acutalibacter sp. 1XD8-36]|nr:phage portal protein [Acutalibacter sp. 1XD8-36]
MACGQDEKERMDFILQAIRQHKSSKKYLLARDAQLYYEGENPTISRYEKIIYDLQGRAHRDMFTANHKIKSQFFQFVVDQEVNYLLGNGVSFGKSATKKKLGKKTATFDNQISLAAEYALVGGEAFGFWNLDHIDVFELTEFVPLEDEENGALSAGVRFWQIDDTKPMRCTLYELDGYTEYIKRPAEDMAVLNEKRPYIVHTNKSEIGKMAIYTGENYPDFPIVPLRNNRRAMSELRGRRNTVDALDLCCSNMVNNVDEGNLIYWVLTNCGGMDDMDEVKFIEHVKTLHVARADGEEGASAEPHSIEAPFEGTSATIDMLNRKLYEDFQAFDSSAVSAGNQTATAIKASYVPLDLKCDKLERQVTAFINGILELAGIDDEPVYTRNQIVNKQEEVQTVLMMAGYVTKEYITRKLLTILGDTDQAEQILKELDAEEIDRFNGEEDENGNNNQDATQEEVPNVEDALLAAEEEVGKTLNGSQTSSLITVIKGLKSGDISEGQAVRILTTSIGVTREEALAIIRGEE